MDTQVDNIAQQLLTIFPPPDSNGVIPLSKFIWYTSAVCKYIKKNKDSIVDSIAKFIYDINRNVSQGEKPGKTQEDKFITPEDIIRPLKESLSTLMDRYFIKAVNYDKLNSILRNNRYIIYLTQYIDIFKNRKNSSYAENLSNIDEVSKLNKYFNLYNDMVVYVLLYNIYKHSSKKIKELPVDILPDPIKFIKTYIYESNVVNEINVTISKFIHEDTFPKILKSYVLMHGAPLSTIAVVPPNKILIIITPFNRYGYVANLTYLHELLTWMLSRENLYNFIKSPACFINSLLSLPGAASEPATRECIINGIQIFYEGQPYFDIRLGQDINDVTNLGSGYYTFDNELDDSEPNKFKKHGTLLTEKVSTTLSHLLNDLSVERPHVPEIIIQHSCRFANDKLPSNIVELIYRYNKIHNIITDTVGECMITQQPPKFTTKFKCGTNYAQYYYKPTKAAANNNKTKKLPISLMNNSMFNNSKLTPIRLKNDTIGGLLEKVSINPYDPKLLKELFDASGDPLLDVIKIFAYPISDYESKLKEYIRLCQASHTISDNTGFDAVMLGKILFNIVNKILKDQKLAYLVSKFLYESGTDYTSVGNISKLYTSNTILYGQTMLMFTNFVTQITTYLETEAGIPKIHIKNIKDILIWIMTNLYMFVSLSTCPHLYKYINELFNSDKCKNYITYLKNICDKYLEHIKKQPITSVFAIDVNKDITNTSHPIITFIHNTYIELIKSPDKPPDFTENTYGHLLAAIYSIYISIPTDKLKFMCIKEGEHIVYTVLHMIMLAWTHITDIQKQKITNIFHTFIKAKLVIGGDTFASQVLPKYGTMFYNIAKLYTPDNEALLDEIVGNMNFIVDEKHSDGNPYVHDRIISRGPYSLLLLATDDGNIKSRINLFVHKHISNWIPKIGTHKEPLTGPIGPVKRSASKNNTLPLPPKQTRALNAPNTIHM
jgi:hypothetical protein